MWQLQIVTIINFKISMNLLNHYVHIFRNFNKNSALLEAKVHKLHSLPVPLCSFVGNWTGSSWLVTDSSDSCSWLTSLVWFTSGFTKLKSWRYFCLSVIFLYFFQYKATMNKYYNFIITRFLSLVSTLLKKSHD